MPAVLFVCTGNICRSPMAMALFRKKLAEHGEQGWRVESAGTWAYEGQQASEGSVIAMSRRGLDLATHLSRRVDHEMLASFDLILTMERNHKEALRIEFPDLAERIMLLSEPAGGRADVRDPFGRNLQDYENTAMEIDHLLDRGYDQIVELARRTELHE
jgi:protein-tyrosine-phosphatase